VRLYDEYEDGADFISIEPVPIEFFETEDWLSVTEITSSEMVSYR